VAFYTNACFQKLKSNKPALISLHTAPAISAQFFPRSQTGRLGAHLAGGGCASRRGAGALFSGTRTAALPETKFPRTVSASKPPTWIRGEKPRCQRRHLITHTQFRDAIQRGQPFGGKEGIILSRLGQNGGGYIEIILAALVLPPFLRVLLMRRQGQIPAAARGEVAGDCSFEVEFWEAQGRMLSAPARGFNRDCRVLAQAISIKPQFAVHRAMKPAPNSTNFAIVSKNLGQRPIRCCSSQSIVFVGFPLAVSCCRYLSKNGPSGSS
jgi:hypothetical protein